MPRDKDRENETVLVMAAIYCRAKHGGVRRDNDGLCQECRAVYDYAVSRTMSCPMGEKKTTCAKCPIHCYEPEMREAVRAIMRYAGPRMIFHHPIMALRHTCS